MAENNHEHGKGIDRSKPMDIICALITLRNDLKLWVANNLRVKLDKNLGADYAGKTLVINSDGDIVPDELSNDALKTTNKTVVGAINELHDEMGDVSTALDSILTQTSAIIGGNS